MQGDFFLEWCHMAPWVLVNSDSGNALLPNTCRTKALPKPLPFGPFNRYLSKIKIKIQQFSSLKKMHLKRSSAKWQPFHSGLIRYDIIKIWEKNERNSLPASSSVSVNTVLSCDKLSLKQRTSCVKVTMSSWSSAPSTSAEMLPRELLLVGLPRPMVGRLPTLLLRRATYALWSKSSSS